MPETKTQLKPVLLPAGEHEYHDYVDAAAQFRVGQLIGEWALNADITHSKPEQQGKVSEDGRSIHFDEITLYHGSATRGIAQFDRAEDVTIGSGFYATNSPELAFGYSRERVPHQRELKDGIIQEGSKTPVVYELQLQDVSFLDLRKPENVMPIMLDFADYMERWVDSEPQNYTGAISSHMTMYKQHVQAKIAYIRGGGKAMEYGPYRFYTQLQTRNLKEVLMQTGDLFAEYVVSSGYDGVIALESGDGIYTKNSPKSESWVIMNGLENATVTNEVTYDVPEVSVARTKQAHPFGELPPPPKPQ